MKKLKVSLFLSLLFASFAAHGQSSDISSGIVSLTLLCSNANSTCDSAGVTTFISNSPFNVQGPSTLEMTTQGYGLAQVTFSGTYAGAVENFEISDDGGTTWYATTCARIDTNIQETSEAISANAFRGVECGVGAATKFRVRQSALTSGAPNVKATLTSGLLEPAPTVQLSASGVGGSNPCVNPHAALLSVSFTTAGNTAVQQIALVAAQKVYGCSLNVIGQSGTTPTFSLVFGTGANCATGQGTLVPAFATPANTLLAFVSPVFASTAGQAVCYLDSGTTPVQIATLTYVQQ
jgi:hypothetical protein